MQNWKGKYNLGKRTISDQSNIKITFPQLGSNQLFKLQKINFLYQRMVHLKQYQKKRELIKYRKEKHFTFSTLDQLQDQNLLIKIKQQEKLCFMQKVSYCNKFEKLAGKALDQIFEMVQGFNSKQEKKLILFNSQESNFVCNFEIEGLFKNINKFP
ncbi:unnamed protein product [Paramecium sonneborni]|uniref:Uncharacterized protein n=1 Tax=Paramecium sonneborni TaxID=65129 RepID=A0A8S1RP72_9CILI|nr:unnamed protein product [Paramecium sonneborni]